MIAAIADGSLSMFDLNVNKVSVMQWREHKREACSVDNNHVMRDKFLSTSYDGSLKIWTVSSKMSMQTLQGHEGIVYQGRWSSREATALITVGADRTVRLWDDRTAGGLIKTIFAHENEILSVDWNPKSGLQFVTGSSDMSIRVWDWRHIGTPMNVLRGHQRAVRRVKWSPMTGNIYSVGYDMTMRVWGLNSLNPLVGMWEGHTEFVTGVDVDPIGGRVATCAWDQSIHLLHPIHYGQLSSYNVI